MPPHVGNEQEWDVSIEATSTVPLHQQEKTQPFPELISETGENSVRFRETTTYREILPLSDITDEEMADVWYNEEEYGEIKNHVTATIKRAADGEPISEAGGYCMRGLEGRTKFGARRRKNNKAKALDAVWTTQVKLWKSKIDNPLIIAAAYKPHATNAKYPAIAVAHDDEKFVKEN
ncbi:MAG: hypothetical protein SGARI_005609, partial [Bacillariaceae sp.]